MLKYFRAAEEGRPNRDCTPPSLACRHRRDRGTASACRLFLPRLALSNDRQGQGHTATSQNELRLLLTCILPNSLHRRASLSGHTQCAMVQPPGGSRENRHRPSSPKNTARVCGRVLTRVVFFPWKLVDGRPIAASTINLFLHRHSNAIIINPNIIWPAGRSKNSIQAASHVPFLPSVRMERTSITTIAISCSPSVQSNCEPHF